MKSERDFIARFVNKRIYIRDIRKENLLTSVRLFSLSVLRKEEERFGIFYLNFCLRFN